jgi:DNA-binding MarR family transcriptional regulator
MKMKSAARRRPNSPLPSLGPVLDFMRLVWALDQALHRTSKRMEARWGLTGPQRLVIRIVARFPGIPAGGLAEILHVDPSTLTGILKRLERQGMLTRRTDAKDRRRVQLGVTAEGRRLDLETEGTVESAVRDALAELPEDKIRNAADVIERIAASLDRTG